MKVEQIYDLVNSSVQEAIGDSIILEKDLSNLVDVGKKIFDSDSVDNYTKNLVNKVGKVKFVSRIYQGCAPNVMVDSWTFGSALQKLTMELPDVILNKTWDLIDGDPVPRAKTTLPVISNKFFNSKTTFALDLTFPTIQVHESFNSAVELNGFISMISVEVDKKFTIAYDQMIRSTINSMIADTVLDAYDGNPSAGESSSRAVNLLHLYQTEIDATLTDPKEAITDPEFIRFASYTMGLYVDRLKNASTLFNMGGTTKFTSKEHLHVIMLSEFKQASNVYLQSDTYHNSLTELPNSESISFWQGTGTNYDFDSTSKIHVKRPEDKTVEMSGILGVMFDRDALGVSNVSRRVDSELNKSDETITNYYKSDAGYFIDGDENFIVFYVK